jgi:dienelactone hydrolase
MKARVIWGEVGVCVALTAVAALAACRKSDGGAVGSTRQTNADATSATAASAPATFTLPKLRAQLKTQIFAETQRLPAREPPKGGLERVFYDAPLGKNVAYVSAVRGGGKRPAIVWIAGGMDWGIESSTWEAQPPSNDQSAYVFHERGIVLLRPSLRGSNENPGRNECFLGEVDDVLAAAAFLAQRSDVDPRRIYIGGHSTGGTMTLLVVASTDRFRAAFAFGPVSDPRRYGNGGCLPAQVSDAEAAPRAPLAFVKEIRTPTLVIEGARGNAGVFPTLRRAKGDAPLQFLLIPGATHFTGLRFASESLADQILADTGAEPRFGLDLSAVSKRVAELPPADN